MAGLRLEVFDTAQAPDGTSQALVEATAVEEAKVASFEQGYSAGWDDAVAAQQDDKGRISADLARNLQSLSFTFQDARSHVLQSVKPLILEMINRLLPEVARETLAPTVLEAVMPLAEDLADAPMTLVLNPAVRSQVEDLLTQATGLRWWSRKNPQCRTDRSTSVSATPRQRSISGRSPPTSPAPSAPFSTSTPEEPSWKTLPTPTRSPGPDRGDHLGRPRTAPGARSPSPLERRGPATRPTGR